MSFMHRPQLTPPAGHLRNRLLLPARAARLAHPAQAASLACIDRRAGEPSWQGMLDWGLTAAFMTRW